MFGQCRIVKSPMVRRFASKVPPKSNWKAPPVAPTPSKKNYLPAIVGFGVSLIIPVYLLWQSKELRDHTFPEKLTNWLENRTPPKPTQSKSLSTGVKDTIEVLGKQASSSPSANDTTTTKPTTKAATEEMIVEIDELPNHQVLVTETIITTNEPTTTTTTNEPTATITTSDDSASTLSSSTSSSPPSSSSPSSLEAAPSDPNLVQEEFHQIDDLLAKYEQSLVENVAALDDAAHMLEGMGKKEAEKDFEEVKDQVRKIIIEQQENQIKPRFEEVVQAEVTATGEQLETKLYDVQAEVKKFLEELLKQRAAAEEVRAEFDALLQKAQSRAKEEFDQALQARTESIERKLQETVNKMIQDALVQQDELMAEAMAYELENRTKIIEQVVKEHYEGERQEQLDAMRLETKAFEDVCAEHSHIHSNSRRLIKLSHALIAVNEAVAEAVPFEPAWKSLREVSTDDEVLSLAMDMVPKGTPAAGAAPISSLQKGFRRVERAGNVASFLPPNPSIYGHLLAQVFGFLTIREPELVPGSDDHACLSRAGYYLKKGDLAHTLEQLDQLTPPVKEVCSDWAHDARERLLLDRSLDLIRARIQELEETLP